MKRLLCLCVCFLWPFTALAHPQQAKKQKKFTAKEMDAILHDTSRPHVRLEALPVIPSPAEPTLTDDEKQHIQGLIAQLAEIASPDYGLSPTMSGHNFAPVSGSERAGALLLTDHKLKQSQAMLALVKLGPRALPLLLEHLDDTTPTQLILKHERSFGGMGFGHEIDFNEANPIERALRDKRRAQKDGGFPDLFKRPLTTYQVKVGDVCFSIVGQIVGRDYLAVRYQPTAIIIINSTATDAQLAEEVRSVWANNAPTARLFHSLLTDYSCRGIYNGFSFDGWGTGSDVQCAAAMRLLYYFPKETAPLLAARLHSLQVQNTGPSVGSQSTDKEMAHWEKWELANGVRTDEFVKAVSWCPDPLIQKEMADIVMRTGDPDVMAAAVRGIAPSEYKRLTPSIQKRLHAEAPSKSAWYYDSYLILTALAHYWGEEARPIFEEYLLQKDPIHLYTVCAALRSDGTEWNRSLLLPLLANKRPIPDLGHWITPKGGGRQILTRVCDAAAQALTTGHSDMDFDMDQPAALLDQQIAAIQKQLKH